MNEIGNKLVENLLVSGRARSSLKKDSTDAAWKTFRDAEKGAYVSAYTGTPNAPLPAPWMNIHLDKKNPRMDSFM